MSENPIIRPTNNEYTFTGVPSKIPLSSVTSTSTSTSTSAHPNDAGIIRMNPLPRDDDDSGNGFYLDQKPTAPMMENGTTGTNSFPNLTPNQNRTTNGMAPLGHPQINQAFTRANNQSMTGGRTVGPTGMQNLSTLFKNGPRIINYMLTDREMEELPWGTWTNTANGPVFVSAPQGFSYPNMVRIRTEPDGSCFFHAIANAFFRPYREEKLNGQPISKRKIIRGLRRDLAMRLSDPVDPLNPDGPIHYDVLSRGTLREFSKVIPNYSLANMQRELNSSSDVDYVYNEFISNQLKKNIFILDLLKRDVYIIGDDDDILYKNRDSIVLLYMPGHYELIGLGRRIQPTGDNNRESGQSAQIPYPLDKDSISTSFAYDHPFIQAIRRRMSDIQATKRNGGA